MNAGAPRRRLPSYAQNEAHYQLILAAIRADGDTAPPLSRRLKQLLQPVPEPLTAPNPAA